MEILFVLILLGLATGCIGLVIAARAFDWFLDKLIQLIRERRSSCEWRNGL